MSKIWSLRENSSHETACGICSESHITRDCPNRDGTLRCINCVRGKKSLTDHTTNWNKCPYLLNAIIDRFHSHAWWCKRRKDVRKHIIGNCDDQVAQKRRSSKILHFLMFYLVSNVLILKLTFFSF